MKLMLIFILVVMAVFIVGINVLPVTKTFTVAYHIKLVNDAGLPLSNVAVVCWNYGYDPVTHLTNDEGEIILTQQLLWTTSVFLSKWKWSAPDYYPVRLHFPDYSAYYFRLEGTKQKMIRYHIFNSTYDYSFGNTLVGTFNFSKNRSGSSSSQLIVHNYSWQKQSQDTVVVSFSLQPDFVH